MSTLLCPSWICVGAQRISGAAVSISDEISGLYVDPRDVRPGLRLQPLQTRPEPVSEAEVDRIIAQTLAKSRQEDARAALPQVVDQEELLGLAGRNARRDAATREAANIRRAQSAARVMPKIEDLTGRRVAGPWQKRVLIAAPIVLVVIWKPWLILGLVIVVCWLVIAAFAALGGARVAEGSIRFYVWLDARNPERAERMRDRADRLAMRLDALLDRLPERWTEGLYMPDFSRASLMGDGLDGRPDPFDRIAAEARHL